MKDNTLLRMLQEDNNYQLAIQSLFQNDMSQMQKENSQYFNSVVNLKNYESISDKNILISNITEVSHEASD